MKKSKNKKDKKKKFHKRLNQKIKRWQERKGYKSCQINLPRKNKNLRKMLNAEAEQNQHYTRSKC